MTDIDTLKDQVRKKAKWLKYGLAAAAIILIGPLFYWLAYALVGAALAGIAAGFAFCVAGALAAIGPYLAMKFENTRINLILAEAAQNPIPTLWNQHRKDQEEVEEMAKAILDYDTEIENLKGKARTLSSDLSPDDLAAFDSDIRAMQEDLALQVEDLDNARADLAKQALEIKRAAAFWQLNMAVSAANSKNVASRAEDTMARLKKETALDSVTSSTNRSKAQLRARIRNRTSALPNNPSPSLQLNTQERIECSAS
jgi:multidrug efflux pump subunit AcrB